MQTIPKNWIFAGISGAILAGTIVLFIADFVNREDRSATSDPKEIRTNRAPDAGGAKRESPPVLSSKLKLIDEEAIRRLNEDIGLALEWAGELSDRAEYEVAMEAIMENAKHLDPYQSKAALKGFESAGKIQGLLLELAAVLVVRWAQAEPWEALKWIEGQEFSTEKRTVIVSNIVPAMFAKDKSMAVQFVEDLMVGTMQDEAYLNLISTWGREDLNAALDFTDGMQDSDLKARSLNFLATEIARSDIDSAKQLYESAPQEPFQTYLEVAIADRLAESDPESAFEFAENLEPETKSNILMDATYYWGEFDPSKCAAHLKKIENEEERNTLTVTLADSWSRNDPAAAARWYIQTNDGISNPNDDTIYSGYRIASNWLELEPKKATQWLHSMERGSLRDSIVNIVVNKKTTLDPEERFELALSIDNDEFRQAKTREAIEDLANTDPSKAKNILKKARLPAAEKNTLSVLLN